MKSFKIDTKNYTIFRGQVTSEVLDAAEEVAATLPAGLRPYAARKISAARKSGTLTAAIKAGKDIAWMAENPARMEELASITKAK